MNRSAVLLVGSLVGNGVLLAAILALPAPSSNEPGPTKAATHEVISQTAAPVSAATTGAPPTGQGSWQALYSDDLPTLTRRLTEAGCPRHVVRSVIERLIADQYTARRKAIPHQDEDELPFWRVSSRVFGNHDPDTPAKLAALERERRTQLAAALGPDHAFEDESFVAQQRRRYGVTDESKLAQLARIDADYSEVIMEATSGRLVGSAAELAAKNYETIQAERRADIAAILSPEEFAEYEIRQSPAALAMRQSMTAFRATEEEYRALFPLYQAMLAERDATRRSAGAAAPPTASPMEALVAQAKNLLTPERHADFEQAASIVGVKLPRLLARLEVPLATAKPLNAIRADILQRASAVRKDTSMSEEDRTAHLNALAREAQEKITETLGPRGFRAYQDYSGGWIGELTAASRP